MNPLLDVNANLSTNKKTFEQERSEYTAFKSEVDPILAKLQSNPENQQSFFASIFSPVVNIFYSPSANENSIANEKNIKVKCINEAVENCKTIEELEVELINLESEIENFDPASGASWLLHLTRKFQHIHQSILKCRVNIVANIIRCDTEAATKLSALSEQYAKKIEEIKAKLNDLEVLDLKVNEDMSGKYELQADPARAKKLTPSQARVTELHEHLKNNYDLDLRAALAEPLAKITEINKKIRSARTLEELEQYQIDLLVHQQLYDKAVLVFVNQKRGDVFIGAMIDEIDLEVKARGKEIKALKEQSTIQRARTRNWESKQWGLLLNSDTFDKVAYKGMDKVLLENIQKVFNYRGFSFRNTVNALKNERHSIKEQMKSVAAGTSEYIKLEQKLGVVNRTLYHCILNRSLDVIAEKEWQIRQPGIDPMQQEALHYDLKKLNEKFDSTLEKFRNLEKVESKRPVKDAAIAEMKDFFVNLIPFGFYTGRIDTVGEILVKRQYADMGYSMMHYMPVFIDSLKVKDNQSMHSYILDQVKEFLKWADKHPEKASMMMGDLMLSVTLLTRGDKSEGSPLHLLEKHMQTRAYAMAFVAPLGAPAWEEIETVTDLKYRALADCARYTPAAAGAGVSVVTAMWNGTFNPVSLIQAAVVGATGAAVVQTVASKISSRGLVAANAVVQVLKGDGVKAIFETQRSIEIARLAGITKKAILNPTRLMDTVKQNITIWWETFKQSKGMEKFVRGVVQIGVPALGVLGGLGLLALAIVGGPVSLTVAFGVALTLFMFSGTFVWNSNSILNGYFSDTYEIVYEQIVGEAKNKAKNDLLARHRDKVEAARKNYIRDLQAARQLPYIKAPKKVTLTGPQTLAVETITNKIRERIKESLASITFDPVEEFQKKFNVNAVLAEAMAAINEDPELEKMRRFDKANVAGDICWTISEQLMREWLAPRLDDRLAEVAVNTTDTELAEMKTYKNEQEYVRDVTSKTADVIKEELQKGVDTVDENGNRITVKLDPEKAGEAVGEQGKNWVANLAEMAR